MLPLSVCPKCGREFAETPGSHDCHPDPRIGQLIEKEYRIDAVLGKGSRGRVYLATYHDGTHQRAVKFLSRPVSEQGLARFRLATRCDHPAMVALRRWSTGADDSTILIMEYADGERLDRRLARGPLSPQLAIQMGACLADALAALQAAGETPEQPTLLEPKHIYLRKNPMEVQTPVLITVHHWQDPVAEPTPGMAGAPSFIPSRYFSPEEIKSQAPTSRTIEFKLGCLLYEALSGQRPFLAQTLGDVAVNVLTSEPGEPLKNIPYSLCETLDRLLSKNPEQRFGNLTAVANALRSEQKFEDEDPIQPLSYSGQLSSPPMMMPGHLPPNKTLAIDPGLGYAEEVDTPLPSWLGIDAPGQMNVGMQALVRVVAIRELLHEALVKGALQQENQQMVQVALRRAVRLELVALNELDFGINPLTPAEQAVSGDELTVWEWLITAQQAGAEKILLLKVTNLVEAGERLLGKAQPSKSIQVHVTVKGGVAAPIFDTAGLRKLLAAVLRADADFEALCMDHFPSIQQRFSAGMDRVQKTNLLLSYASAPALYKALQASYPEASAAHTAACALVMDSAQPQLVTRTSTGVLKSTPLLKNDFPLRPAVEKAAPDHRLIRGLSIATAVLFLIVIALVLRSLK